MQGQGNVQTRDTIPSSELQRVEKRCPKCHRRKGISLRAIREIIASIDVAAYGEDHEIEDVGAV